MTYREISRPQMNEEATIPQEKPALSFNHAENELKAKLPLPGVCFSLDSGVFGPKVLGHGFATAKFENKTTHLQRGHQQQQPPLLRTAKQPAPPTTHHCRRHRRSFLALEPEGAGPRALPIGGSSCHSFEASPHSRDQVRVFSASQSHGVEGEALIGSLRRRAYSQTSKDLTSTPRGGPGPGEVEKNKAGSIAAAIENLWAWVAFKPLRCCWKAIRVTNELSANVEKCPWNPGSDEGHEWHFLGAETELRKIWKLRKLPTYEGASPKPGIHEPQIKNPSMKIL
ncbi:uncharacterized protein LOC106975709 [Acinonyx jubatus]|uniref:Uncharacterized protein LOC106975709 n=1 Tax=Acinonyx jubatus TaxID=32536 RepID=A0ABM3PQ05_ACIJB|nr:uncharacterized protein LOC106975709 [Acinonyx jubatus]